MLTMERSINREQKLDYFDKVTDLSIKKKVGLFWHWTYLGLNIFALNSNLLLKTTQVENSDEMKKKTMESEVNRKIELWHNNTISWVKVT